MWFLIKGSVWLGMGLVVLSFFSTRPDAQSGTGDAIQLTGAISAANEAYRYVSAICSEKPDVCEKGSETFTVLGQRAREGALVAFEFLDRQFSDQPGREKLAVNAQTPATEGQPDAVTTGTVVPLPTRRPAL